MTIEDGRKAKTDEENAQAFAKHFNKLFNNQLPLPCDPTTLDLIDQLPDFTRLAAPISLQEVCAALQRMANGKAAGPSGITSDALNGSPANADANFLASVIHDLLLDFWESNLDFESWKQGTLAPVPKSGDLSNPNKWRPVCLLETSYKVLASIIAHRINPVIRDNGLEAQCGSLNSKGCPDANFSLRSAIQIRR
eukprot:13042569-Ditylum_brightwellii.AAC.1